MPRFHQFADRLQDARMLDWAGENRAGSGTDKAEDGEIICLGGAAGKEDFIGIGIKEAGDVFAASSRARRAARPKRWLLAGLPG